MTIPHKHPLERHTSTKNVRSATIRKSGRDGPSWTPTEQRKRDKLMRQFCSNQEGWENRDLEAYKQGWDAAFGEREARRKAGLCPGCGADPFSEHAKGCDEEALRPYKITHHGKIQPTIILSPEEGGDPMDDVPTDWNPGWDLKEGLPE